LFENVIAEDDSKRSLGGIQRRLLDEKFVETRIIESVGFAEIGSEFFGGDIVKNDLELLVGFEAANEHINGTPQSFERLEIRMVKNRAHRGSQGGVHGGNELVLPRVFGGHNVGRDGGLEHLRDGDGAFRGRGRRADEAGEIAQFAIDRNGRAAGTDAPWACNLNTGPRLNFFSRLGERGLRFEPLPQAGEFAEDRQVRVQLVWMKIVHRVDGHLDDRAIGTHRQAQFDGEALDGGVNIVAINLERFAGSEGGAGVELAAVGASREIAQ